MEDLRNVLMMLLGIFRVDKDIIYADENKLAEEIPESIMHIFLEY